MRITLLGQFGSGNSGNDGSLEAMLLYLRRMRPDADLLCICASPTVVSAKFNIRSMGVGGPPLTNAWMRQLDKMLGKVPRRLQLLVSSLFHFDKADLMIIPGTGILDDFQEKWFGWPFVVFCWCLVARLRNTRIAFVSIGAGPMKSRLSRWFLRSAAQMASYRSYRDDFSLNYMKMIGVDVSRDHRYPDIAFDLPVPVPHRESSADGVMRIGVGVMDYRGWRHNDPEAAQIYKAYIHKLSRLVSWLIGEGHRITLLMGDVTDKVACADLMFLLTDMLSRDEMSQIEISSAATLRDIMQQMAAIDLAVVSRYHGLVCSLKLGNPTISIGYARKFNDLMSDFDQDKFARHIDTFEVEDVIGLVKEILAGDGAVRQRIAHANERFKRQLSEQEALLGREFLSTDRVATPQSVTP
ncbi:exopolysaccharide biosynthesis protein [Rhizobium rhizogenes]|uniref:Exopolysaccharide biosynthesis protein n=1 Tax=Rhizobium rhizogenes TaxID=359 RepID=A0AA88EXE4_RHIRH|nr:polysaccharide pyruvyl transferase family protein [Rhizobium rhizogenes]KAA3499059.1 exopolysaccharide biosynthesis protein [Rhizobium rhizogenes]